MATGEQGTGMRARCPVCGRPVGGARRPSGPADGGDRAYCSPVCFVRGVVEESGIDAR